MSDIVDRRPPDKIKVFVELCWARALLWAEGEYSLQQAVDSLQDWAVKRGLVREIGQDGVQAIMANSFRMIRYMLAEDLR
jgi:hypothetical protein